MLPLMQIMLSSALLLLGAGLAAIPTSPSAVLIENSEVKVARALEQAHVQGKFHQHERNRVMVYLQPGTQRFQYQDGRKPQVFNFKAGQVVWSPASGMHAGEVLDHDFNIIEVELKNTGTSKPIGGKLDPVKVDPGDYKVAFENPQVRVLRVTIPPHGKVPMHAHTTDHVTVFLTDQDFRIKDSTGKVEAGKHKAGEVAFAAAAEHAEENLSDQPFEAVAVEIK